MMTDRPGVSSTMCRRRASRVRRAGNGDAGIRLLQGRRIVHAVAGHADDVAVLLEHFDDVILVLRENLGEAVRLFDGLVQLAGLVDVLVSANMLASRMFVPKPDLLGDFLADGDLVARDHLHADAHFLGGGDGGLRVFARRIGQRQHAEELPGSLLVRCARRPASESRGRRTR